MEYSTNHFDELRKLLLAAVEVLEQSNSNLVKRIEALEKEAQDMRSLIDTKLQCIEKEPEISENSQSPDSEKEPVIAEKSPDWYDWEVDYPAAYIDDIYKGISVNDRYEFVKELFNVTGNLSDAEMIFKETLDDINGMNSFKEVVAYIRKRFPQWDEMSEEVYRFYMIVRRKFN